MQVHQRVLFRRQEITEWARRPAVWKLWASQKQVNGIWSPDTWPEEPWLAYRRPTHKRPQKNTSLALQFRKENWKELQDCSPELAIVAERFHLLPLLKWKLEFIVGKGKLQSEKYKLLLGSRTLSRKLIGEITKRPHRRKSKMTGLRAPALSLLVVILLFDTTSSFYLPGVAPTDYAKGEEMHVKVRTYDFMLPTTKSVKCLHCKFWCQEWSCVSSTNKVNCAHF